MGNFWKATDRPDLQQVHIAVIADPGKETDGSNILWLDNPPAGAVNGLAKIDYGTGKQPLEWVNAPPASGTANTDITATWKGGVAPYTATVKQGSTVASNQTGTQTSITANVNGTSKPLGAWVWTVTDAEGTSITGSTTITAPALAFTTALPTGTPQLYLSSGQSDAARSVVVTGGIPPYHYAWKRNPGGNMGNDDPTLPTDTVDARYGVSGNYSVSVTVTDSRQPADAASAISSAQAVSVWDKLTISQQPPATLSVAAGAELRFQVIGAGGKAARSYTWYKDGVLIANPNPDSSAGPSVFRKLVTTAADAGSYVGRVTDANGKTVDSAPCVVTIT